MASVAEAILAGHDLHVSGRAAEAEVIYRRVLAVDPTNGTARQLLGILLAQYGRPIEGTAQLRLAVADAPDSAERRLNLGNVERVAGRTPLANAHFRRAVTLGADDAELVETDISLGRVALATGRPAEAEALLLDAVRRRPGRLDVTADLAAARCDLNDHEGAIRALRLVAAGIPARHPNLHDQGVRERLRGRNAEAARLFRRADAVLPDHPDTTERLADALFHAGSIEEARAIATAILARKDREARGDPPAASPPLPLRAPGPRTKRVVAFSLWGSGPIHLVGALENVRLMPEYLPGWICRIYHDDSVPRDVVQALAASGAETVTMEPGGGPRRGSLWRFLASDDPEVDLFLCRDADSRPNAREAAAVEAWLASGRPFHVMRDHILHTELMMAGMWGGRAGLLPSLDEATTALVRDEDGRLRDQRFLARHIWPRIADHALIHDSAHSGAGVPLPAVPIDARHAFQHVGARVEPD